MPTWRARHISVVCRDAVRAGGPDDLTTGPRGATLLRAGHDPLEIPALRIDVMDTVGAGDASMAALVSALAARDLLSPDSRRSRRRDLVGAPAGHDHRRGDDVRTNRGRPAHRVGPSRPARRLTCRSRTSSIPIMSGGRGRSSSSRSPSTPRVPRLDDVRRTHGDQRLRDMLRDMVLIREFETMLDRIKSDGAYEGHAYRHRGPAHLGYRPGGCGGRPGGRAPCHRSHLRQPSKPRRGPGQGSGRDRAR